MTRRAKPTARTLLVWALLIGVIAAAIAGAAISPLLAYRQPVYILGGFAGIVALALVVVQPLLAAGLLPGLHPLRARRVHRWAGAGLISAVVVHVAALWRTSPPDVIDALLFRSPTPFSGFGVTAMWAVFAAGALAVLRRRLRPALWRAIHLSLAVLIVTGTIAHALLITGTMETTTKSLLCLAALTATALALTQRSKSRRKPVNGDP
ncbi:ferric reductase-like transmembrane domain-containing protein [Rhodobacteraceae bacterium D3-12]|nr:ferric reductase-like transmembrane domain-containing protein [Rhodobacteraceae bacterium D3-12]